jgi:hypothetical protein
MRISGSREKVREDRELKLKTEGYREPEKRNCRSSSLKGFQRVVKH